MEAEQIAQIITALLELIGAVFGIESSIGQTIVSVFAVLSVVVGAASTVVAGLEKIAEVTPTDKDNKAIGKARRFIATVVAILDRVALNPDEKRARKAKLKDEDRDIPG